MARPLRIEYDGALYHVMSRGNERRSIVRDDVDRRKRLEWLRRTVETYGWRLHAFVLMTNHDHLFVETPEANLSSGMQYFNGSYTGYFNKRRGRSGHLFQGRFKSQLIEEQGHYWEVSRYIHLNPVRAGMVVKPEFYRWSSYPGYHRKDRELSWMTYDRVLKEFGRSKAVSRSAYRRYVQSGMSEQISSPVKSAKHGIVVGSSAFISKISRLLESRVPDPEVPQLSGMRARPSLDEINLRVQEAFNVPAGSWNVGDRVDNASRAVAAYLGRAVYGYSRQSVAEHLGYRTGSSVTEAIRRYHASVDRLKTKVKVIRKSLDKTTIDK